MTKDTDDRPRVVQPREDFGAKAPPSHRTHGSSKHSPGHHEHKQEESAASDQVTRRRRQVILPPRTAKPPERKG
jgi:hypothetical protein